MKKLSFLLLAMLPFGVYAQKLVPDAVLKAIDAIDSNRIKASVTYLADDKLKGRLPGTEGYKMAVDYVAGQFKQFGLQPVGDNESYLQNVTLRKARVVKESVELALTLPNGQKFPLTLGENFFVYPHPEKTSVDFNAPLVFVGAGFDAPQIGRNDYKDLDVKGKIVIILRKLPDNVPANVRLHLQYATTLQEFAAKNGAIGVIICNPASVATAMRTNAATMSASGVSVSVTTAGKRTSSGTLLGGTIQVAAGIPLQAFRSVMQAENIALDTTKQSFDESKFVSKELKSTISGRYKTTFEDILSYNVIGKVEGTDPVLKNEYVIHSGHIDHLGIGRPVNGDSIYNGAHDNASGVASALEIARTYANLPTNLKPKRSILFMFFTAEEMGLLGSGFFTAFPTVPKQQIVADVNTDMPTLIAPLESVAPLGAEHSSLLNVVEDAASLVNLGVEPDPDPAEGRFVRSDQYNFVKAGIPALHVKYGYKKANPALNLPEKVRIWREANYHKPSDEVTNGFVWSAGRKYAQVNFLISYLIAQNPNRPTWNKGDFFEVKK